MDINFLKLCFEAFFYLTQYLCHRAIVILPATTVTTQYTKNVRRKNGGNSDIKKDVTFM